MAYLNRAQRNQLLQNQIDANQAGMIKALRAARLRVEQRMIEAARDERFATVRRIRDGVYKDIGAEYTRLQGDLDTWTQESILSTSKAYHALAAADLLATDDDKLASSFTKFNAKHNEEYFAKVHPFNAEKMAAVNVHLNPQLVRMAETDVRALRSATVDALREAHIAGMTPVERFNLLRSKVMDYADNPKSWRFIDKGGRRWQKNNYFDTLNRTVTANVARDTYHDALAEEDRDLVLILGGVSAESRDACAKYNGKVVSVTGATAGFATLDDYISEGGFGPNCVHSTAYVSKTFGPHKKLIEEQGGEIAEVEDESKNGNGKHALPPIDDSKLETGEPATLNAYHGTRKDFDSFDATKAGENTDRIEGNRVFFVDDYDEAKFYTEKVDADGNARGGSKPQVLSAKIELDNPLVVRTKTNPTNYFDRNQTSLIDEIDSEDYDSIVIIGQVDGRKQIFITIEDDELASIINRERI